MLDWLFRTKPERIVADMLHEARRELVHHEAAAEYHAAQASMYRARIARLAPAPQVAPPEVEAYNRPADHADARVMNFESVRNAVNAYNNPANLSKGIL